MTAPVTSRGTTKVTPNRAMIGFEVTLVVRRCRAAREEDSPGYASSSST